MWTVNDVLVNPYLFLVLVNPYPFYCIKKIWIDQNKKGHGSTKTSLMVHANACINTIQDTLGYLHYSMVSLNCS